jgi:hypothetical protein
MDNLLTNKYFCLALIVIVLVLIYMWSTSSSCNVSTNERMNNVDLSSAAPNLSEKPYVDDVSDDSMYPYKRYDNAFDRNADTYVQDRLKQEGYDRYTNNFLVGTDKREAAYQKYNRDVEQVSLPYARERRQGRQQRRQYDANGDMNAQSDDYQPKPLDDRPDLGQCQPCKPCTRQHAQDETSEDDYQYGPIGPSGAKINTGMLEAQMQGQIMSQKQAQMAAAQPQTLMRAPTKPLARSKPTPAKQARGRTVGTSPNGDENCAVM